MPQSCREGLCARLCRLHNGRLHQFFPHYINQFHGIFILEYFPFSESKNLNFYGKYSNNFFCEIDLFDFTSFLGLDFFNISGLLWGSGGFVVRFWQMDLEGFKVRFFHIRAQAKLAFFSTKTLNFGTFQFRTVTNTAGGTGSKFDLSNRQILYTT